MYAPVSKPKDDTRDPHEPLPKDSAAVAAWRQRMGTEEAKAIYRSGRLPPKVSMRLRATGG